MEKNKKLETLVKAHCDNPRNDLEDRFEEQLNIAMILSAKLSVEQIAELLEERNYLVMRETTLNEIAKYYKNAIEEIDDFSLITEKDILELLDKKGYFEVETDDTYYVIQ